VASGRGPARERRFAGDHDLGRLDDRERIVAAAEFELDDRVARDHGRQVLVADAELDLTHQAVGPYFLDEPAQPVAAGERDDEPGVAGGLGVLWRGGRGRLPRDEPFDLGFRNPVVAARRLRRPQFALLDPELDGGVADAQALGRGAHGEEGHGAILDGFRRSGMRVVAKTTTPEVPACGWLKFVF
jgi:hypothetical protein